MLSQQIPNQFQMKFRFGLNTESVQNAPGGPAYQARSSLVRGE